MAKRKSGFGNNHSLLLLLVSLSVLCIGLSLGQQYPQQYYQQAQPSAAQYGGQQQQYAAQYQIQPQVQQAVQSSPIEDHREVDEKDYSVSGGSSWLWFLGMPIIFIPLILLLCTPMFHKPHDSPYSYGGDHGGHHSSGYGWGGYGYKDGWKRSSDDKVKEDVTTRVLKGISNTASNNSKKFKSKAAPKSASETSRAVEQRG